MKVLVAGAHGKTARRLVRILTEDGHEVRGLVRKEEQMPDVEADGTAAAPGAPGAADGEGRRRRRKEEQRPVVGAAGTEAVLVDLEEGEVEGRSGEAGEGCDAIVFA